MDKTCYKMGFVKRKDALREIKQAKAKNRAARSMRVYLCECCGEWHLTSWTKKQMRRLRKRNG